MKTALWLPPTATNQPVAWCLTPLLHQFTLHLALLLETKKLNIYKNIYKALRRTLKQEGEKKEKYINKIFYKLEANHPCCQIVCNQGYCAIL